MSTPNKSNSGGKKFQQRQTGEKRSRKTEGNDGVVKNSFNSEDGPRNFGGNDRGPRPEGGGFNRGPRPEGGGFNRGPRPEGGGFNRGPRPEGGGFNRGPRPEGGGFNRGPRPEGGGFNRGPRPEGGGFNRGPRPEGGGFNRGPRPEGGGFNRGPRPEGGGFNRGPRPEGGGFNRGPRPEGGGFNRGPRPEGGGFNRGPRPEGGGFNRGPRPEGGGFNRGPRPEGGGFNRGPRPEGGGFNRGPRPEGGGFNRGPRPEGGGFNRGPRPEGGGFNRGPRPEGGGFNRGPRPEGGGFNRGPRPEGGGFNRGSRPEGGGFNRGPRPEGGGFNRGPRPEGGGFNRGPRPEGGGFNRGPRPEGGGFNRGPRPEGGGFNRGPRPEGGGFNRGPRPEGGGFNRDNENRGGFKSRFNSNNNSEQAEDKPKKLSKKKQFDFEITTGFKGSKKDFKQAGDKLSLGKELSIREIRLNRYIANSGMCSRREADSLIEQGLVKINGEVVTELGSKVRPRDEVKIDGRKIVPEQPVYIILNKPKGYITTTSDPEGRDTVMELIDLPGKERIYPIGRLDRNTTGVLLLTNDGEFAQKLTHPSFEIKKVYRVTLDSKPTKDHMLAWVEGVQLEDGLMSFEQIGWVEEDEETVLGVEIHSGRNRIVRRMFEHFGYEVTGLDRVLFGEFDKLKLGRSKWRFLTEKEIAYVERLKRKAPKKPTDLTSVDLENWE